MGNLEKIVNEKKEKLFEIESNTINNLSNEDKKYDSLKKKLNKEHDDNIDSIKQTKIVTIEKVNTDYSTRLAETLIDDLKFDYNIIKNREEYKNISDEQIEQAISVKKTISEIKNKKQKNILLDVMLPETKKLVEIEDLETLKKPKEVITYVASTKGECYILLPASGEDTDKLNKDLTDKFLGILNQGKVHMSPGHCIAFNLKDIEYPQGFVMFKLETSEPKLVQRKLLEDLNDKNLQPKSFIDNNLTNKSVCLDYDILKNFLNYNPVQESEPVQVVKKLGRPLGSKNKKTIDNVVNSNESLGSHDFAAMEPQTVPLNVNNPEYDAIKSKYDALSKEAGHPLTRTEVNQKYRTFYNSIRDLEKEGVNFDFLHYPKNYSSRSTSKKKE